MLTLDCLAAAVLQSYPHPFQSGSVVRHLGASGFSGAAIFRVAGVGGCLCLRAWPPQQNQGDLLQWTQQLLGKARERGLSFVPRVFSTTQGWTFVHKADRFWELQEWMPGHADFRQHPSSRRLENACAALAHLHRSWDDAHASVGPCPAVRRRLLALRRWNDFQFGACTAKNPASQAVSQRAAHVLSRWLPSVAPWLTPWTHRPFVLHPCHCDIWHDHILYVGDQVTGLIDFGAAKVDHAAVDLARLLGSLVEDDDAAWQTGLAAYRTARPFNRDEERLARCLDATGTVLGVANWLQRLVVEKRTEEEEAAALRRLETLVCRMERWETPLPFAAMR
jgi:Ser/Thr protein kinase RdoA (MazF antagonist)